MEYLLKNQQNIRLSGASASYKNGTTEHGIKIVITIMSNMIIHTVLRFTKDTLSAGFGKLQYNMLYGYTVGTPCVQSCLSFIKKWPITGFDTLSKILNNCHAWCFDIFFVDKVVEYWSEYP